MVKKKFVFSPSRFSVTVLIYSKCILDDVNGSPTLQAKEGTMGSA